MIVQPASIGPSSRPRRILRIVGVLVPVVLLAAVVGIGALGPTPEPDRERAAVPTGAPVVAVADPSPAPNVVPGDDLGRAAFPGHVAGLQVHGVRWTLEARSRGIVRGGVVAVAGYLVLDQPSAGCGATGLGNVVPFCERTGVLAEDPWAGGPLAESDLPDYHLHPQVPAGVRVPYVATGAAGLGGSSRPVVVLARFDDPRARRCLPAGRHCGQELVVERIAWIGGEDFPRIVTVDPRVAIAGTTDEELRQRASRAVSSLVPEGYPFLVALVRTDTLSAIDPDAAAGLAPDTAVWYVRGLHETGDPGRIDWLVVDALGERTLASGSISTTPAAGRGAP